MPYGIGSWLIPSGGGGGGGGQNILVYDMGGGTFDVTLLEIEDGGARLPSL